MPQFAADREPIFARKVAGASGERWPGPYKGVGRYMPPQGRLGDKASVPVDTHGCPACPHPGIGPAINGSPDTLVNGLPALRVDDPGVHAACCGSNLWTATQGSATVFINGKPAHRQTDQNRHCGGMGRLIEGSPNVITGGTTTAGAGGEAAGPAGGGGGGAAGGGGSGGAGAGAAGGGAGGTAGGGGASGGGGANGGGGGSDVPPGGNDAPPDEDELSFVDLELVDAEGDPVPNERYRVTAANGQVFEGTLDASGQAHVEQVAAGECKIEFPDRGEHDYVADAGGAV